MSGVRERLEVRLIFRSPNLSWARNLIWIEVGELHQLVAKVQVKDEGTNLRSSISWTYRKLTVHLPSLLEVSAWRRLNFCYVISAMANAMRLARLLLN
jgi:hypothetical protein